ncbi:MAG: hypothetical protein HWN65_15845 [Candidatus Helarchaeota archaeon]|nr:hypothetical protein [Candidatus Helarchaeota archaeon]
MVTDYNYLANFCQSFCEILERYTRYIVVSGFLVISSGRSRGTEDIDVIIEPIDLDIYLKLHEELKKNQFQCLQSSDPNEIYNKYLKEKIPIRFIQNDKLIPNIELKFAKDELDEYQLKTRKKIELTEINVFFSSIEANIAFKEELLKTPKDLDDARHLRIVYSGEIDEKEIEKLKKMIKKYRL